MTERDVPPALLDSMRLLAAASSPLPIDLDKLDLTPRCEAGCGREPVPRTTLCAECSTNRVREQRRSAVRAALASLNGPTFKQVLPLENVDQVVRDAAAVAAVREIAADLTRVQSVLLWGPSRAGKSTLARSLLYEQVRKGAHPNAPRELQRVAERLRFVRADDLITARAAWKYGTPFPSFEDADRAPALGLDEVGATHDSLMRDVFLLLERRGRRFVVMTTPCLSRDAMQTNTGNAGLVGRAWDDAERAGGLIHVRLM